MDKRHSALGAGAPYIAHLFRIGAAGRGALDREVVYHHTDVASGDPTETGDLAVARRACGFICGIIRTAKQTGLEETVLIHQSSKPFGSIELALFATLSQFPFATHGGSGLAPLVKIGHQG